MIRRALLWLQSEEDAATVSGAVRFVEVISDPDTLREGDWVVVTLAREGEEQLHRDRGIRFARERDATVVGVSKFCKWARLMEAEQMSRAPRPGTASGRRLDL